MCKYFSHFHLLFGGILKIEVIFNKYLETQKISWENSKFQNRLLFKKTSSNHWECFVKNIPKQTLCFLSQYWQWVTTHVYIKYQFPLWNCGSAPGSQVKEHIQFYVVEVDAGGWEKGGIEKSPHLSVWEFMQVSSSIISWTDPGKVREQLLSDIRSSEAWHHGNVVERPIILWEKCRAIEQDEAAVRLVHKDIIKVVRVLLHNTCPFDLCLISGRVCFRPIHPILEKWKNLCLGSSVVWYWAQVQRGNEFILFVCSRNCTCIETFTIFNGLLSSII